MLTSYFKRRKIHNADLLEYILRVIVFQPLSVNRICQSSPIKLRQPVVTTSMCFSDNVWSIPIRRELGWRSEVSSYKFRGFQNHLSFCCDFLKCTQVQVSQVVIKSRKSPRSNHREWLTQCKNSYYYEKKRK